MNKFLKRLCFKIKHERCDYDEECLNSVIIYYRGVEIKRVAPKYDDKNYTYPYATVEELTKEAKDLIENYLDNPNLLNVLYSIEKLKK